MCVQEKKIINTFKLYFNSKGVVSMTPALQGLTVWTTHFFTQFTENALFKKTDFDFLKVRLDICFQGPEIEWNNFQTIWDDRLKNTYD